ncbi:MAG: hypothetical protein LBF68_03810 [Christensenellaceae bacterium]|jgi:hypothetical protein|nr:hypothetical protein [Christensenellaceae bacterium]
MKFRTENEITFIFNNDCNQLILDKLKELEVSYSVKFTNKTILEIYINTAEYFKEKFVVSKNGQFFEGKYITKKLIPNSNVMSYTENSISKWEPFIFNGISTNCIILKRKTQLLTNSGYVITFTELLNPTIPERKYYYVEIESRELFSPDNSIVNILYNVMQTTGGHELTVADSKISKCKMHTTFIPLSSYQDVIEFFNKYSACERDDALLWINKQKNV